MIVEIPEEILRRIEDYEAFRAQVAAGPRTQEDLTELTSQSRACRNDLFKEVLRQVRGVSS